MRALYITKPALTLKEATMFALAVSTVCVFIESAYHYIINFHPGAAVTKVISCVMNGTLIRKDAE